MRLIQSRAVNRCSARTFHRGGRLIVAPLCALALWSGSAPLTHALLPPVVGPPPPPAGSAGIINDWVRLRDERLSTFDLGAQFRLRHELKENGGLSPDTDFIRRGEPNDNSSLLLRARIHLGWTPASWVTAYVEGRHAAAFLDRRAPSPEQDTMDLYQAFLTLGDPEIFPVTLKIGRQELAYGEQRFVGSGEWANVGRVFDAAKLRFENDRFRIDTFAGRVVLTNDGEINEPNDYDNFWGVYASTQSLVRNHETQLYFLGRNVGDASTAAQGTLGGPGARDIYTLGTLMKSLPGKLGPWDYQVEIAGQFGNIRSGERRLDHRALAADAHLGYTWEKTAGRPCIGVGYTYGSGDSDPADGTNETFEPLFGTQHRFYGAMNLMGLRNLHGPGVNFTVHPAKRMSIWAECLGFWMADTHDFLYPEQGPGRNANGYGRHPGFSPYVGAELDIVATYNIAPWAMVQAAYGHFFAGDYIRQSVGNRSSNDGAVDADWCYVQVILSF